jgi:glycosyltransferase involved in cell wall biosynthesis
LVVFGGIAPKEKVHVTGHPTDWEEIMERMPEWYQPFRFNPTAVLRPVRMNKVVYSSRFDSEKQPHLFLAIARRVIAEKPDTQIVVCTGGKQLRSNDPTAVESLKLYCKQYPQNFFLKENLSKEDYYSELVTAKIQINTALQDFDAITLHEASVAGCFLLYPYFRSFPEVLRHQMQYFYQPGDAAHAASRVCEILSRNDLWSFKELEKRAWIHTRLKDSVRRMLKVMGFWKAPVEPLYPGDE